MNWINYEFDEPLNKNSVMKAKQIEALSLAMSERLYIADPYYYELYINSLIEYGIPSAGDVVKFNPIYYLLRNIDTYLWYTALKSYYLNSDVPVKHTLSSLESLVGPRVLLPDLSMSFPKDTYLWINQTKDLLNNITMFKIGNISYDSLNNLLGLGSTWYACVSDYINNSNTTTTSLSRTYGARYNNSHYPSKYIIITIPTVSYTSEPCEDLDGIYDYLQGDLKYRVITSGVSGEVFQSFKNIIQDQYVIFKSYEDQDLNQIINIPDLITKDDFIEHNSFIQPTGSFPVSTNIDESGMYVENITFNFHD